jgi:hypothetical protein
VASSGQLTRTDMGALPVRGAGGGHLRPHGLHETTSLTGQVELTADATLDFALTPRM